MTTKSTPAPQFADDAPSRPTGERLFMITKLADGTSVIVDTDGDTCPVAEKVKIGYPNPKGPSTLIRIEFDGISYYLSGKTIFEDLCWACDGTGYRPGYAAVDSSRCWPCNYSGLGRKSRIKPRLANLRRAAGRRAAKQAADAAKVAETNRIIGEEKAAFLAANADLVAAANDILSQQDIATNYQIQIAASIATGRPSAKDVELFPTIAQEFAAKLAEIAARIPVPTGKNKITGEIVSIKASDWGLKMLVKDDRGFKVWGTYPAKLDAAGVGDRVAFVADTSRSGNDASFGFFSRPTACRIL